MPLRDHFRPPLDDLMPWDGLHGGWPMKIVEALGPRLPSHYVAAPMVHVGSSIEVDVAAFEAEAPEADAYEVRVYDARRGRRLVAAVELVSPSNKDRPERRRAFVAKCAELIRQGVCVAVVDVVTTRSANLYAELMEHLGLADPAVVEEAPATYAASCRWIRADDRVRLEAWAHPLEVGRPLPTLPLWLAEDLAVPLELEASYEETCRVLRIP